MCVSQSVTDDKSKSKETRKKQTYEPLRLTI